MTLAEAVLLVARDEVGVREEGRNRGPRVDEYLRCAGLDPERGPFAWCAAFVYWCFEQASRICVRKNPLPRTANVHRLWRRAPVAWRASEPQPGSIFLMERDKLHGHAGIVVGRRGLVTLDTIEGNTNVAGSREGDGVYSRSRDIDEINLGFLVVP